MLDNVHYDNVNSLTAVSTLHSLVKLLHRIGQLGLRNSALLLDRNVVTKLLVFGKLNLFFVLLLLALFQYAIHHLDHLLHWCDGMSRNPENSNRNDALICDHPTTIATLARMLGMAG